MAQNMMMQPVEAWELVTIDAGGIANKIGGIQVIVTQCKADHGIR